MTEDSRPFRPCVGILLLNDRGQVFVGARNDIDGDHWQTPQGGIDEGETPAEAALRELEEEVGTAKAEIIGEHDRWIHYRLPQDLSRLVWKGCFQGQKQRWFALRFLGRDEDIDLETDHPEFRDWKWVEIEDLPGLTIEFKRDAYREVRETFRPLVQRIRDKQL